MPICILQVMAEQRDHVTCEPAAINSQRGWKGLCFRLIHLTAAKAKMQFAHFTVTMRSWATVVPQLKKYLNLFIYLFFPSLAVWGCQWSLASSMAFLSSCLLFFGVLCGLSFPPWLAVGCQRRRCLHLRSNYHGSGQWQQWFVKIIIIIILIILMENFLFLFRKCCNGGQKCI